MTTQPEREPKVHYGSETNLRLAYRNDVFSPYVRREKVEPNTALRKADRGIWEPHEHAYDDVNCAGCGAWVTTNIRGICRTCNFHEVMRTLTIIAEPAALREVRRQYGINGESDRADRERKVRRAEAEGETW